LKFSINGQAVAATFDGYADSVKTAPVFPLGIFSPQDGKFRLRIEVAGASKLSKGAKYFFGLDYVVLE
jgi:hypothetical protein